MTKKELIAAIPIFSINETDPNEAFNEIRNNNIGLHYWCLAMNNDEYGSFHNGMNHTALTLEQAIDLYKHENFNKDFIEKL